MMRLAGIALAATMLASSSARADSVASGVAVATVVNPLALRPLSDLNFGVITVSQQVAGSVAITPGASDAHYSGGVRQFCNAECVQPHTAKFEVSGEAGRSYLITTPASISASNESAPALRIESIRLKTASQPDSLASGRINFTGRDHFDLGGTLLVPAGAAPDHYRLNLPVIMTYD